MPNLIKRLREAAFQSRHGRCDCCGAPMRLYTADELATCGLRGRRERPLRCTAAHLAARMQGEQATPDNIVAACDLCNRRRHARKRPLTPAAYRALVCQRLAVGRWHDHDVIALATSAGP